jgi:hypothetical protein
MYNQLINAFDQTNKIVVGDVQQKVWFSWCLGGSIAFFGGVAVTKNAFLGALGELGG